MPVLVLACLLALAPAAPAAQARRHCSEARTVRVPAPGLYTLVLSVPRCYDGRRVSLAGRPVVRANITLLGLVNAWSAEGVLAGPVAQYRSFRGNRRGELRVTRRIRFGHCIEDPRLGCLVQLPSVDEAIGLRALADGRVLPIF